MGRIVFLVLLSCVSWAAAYAQYVKEDLFHAWPKKVPVLKGDPVMGDKAVWVHWTYDKTFAQRFAGFDPASANADMTPGVHAIAFRTYKKQFIGPQGPDLYECEYEVFFTSELEIPLNEQRAAIAKNPSGVTFAFEQLSASSSDDALALSKASQSLYTAKSLPLIVADGKLFGRYQRLGLTYFPNLVPGISVARLTGWPFCSVIAPKLLNTHYWIWLFGELSLSEGRNSQPYQYSEDFRKWLAQGTFELDKSQSLRETNGRLVLPESFYEVVLTKVTLIKALNSCIMLEHEYKNGARKDLDGRRSAFRSACEKIEKTGEIIDVRRGPQQEGLQIWGFT